MTVCLLITVRKVGLFANLFGILVIGHVSIEKNDCRIISCRYMKTRVIRYCTNYFSQSSRGHVCSRKLTTNVYSSGTSPNILGRGWLNLRGRERDKRMRRCGIVTFLKHVFN